MDSTWNLWGRVKSSEPNLSPAENAAAFCTSYLAKMNDLLRCPHARTFIGEGGQLSWIARRWTGLRMVEEFMAGLSIQVTVHNRGFYDSTSQHASYLSHDAISEQEKDLLLGYCLGMNCCLGRWLFPPTDVFEDHFELWTGEWNAALDPILHHAPLIPAGMNPFHWNPQESAGMAQESTGMGRNPQEWTGMALEWTKMDILEIRV